MASILGRFVWSRSESRSREATHLKITGLKALIFAPRPNYHREVPEYVTAKMRGSVAKAFEIANSRSEDMVRILLHP